MMADILYLPLMKSPTQENTTSILSSAIILNAAKPFVNICYLQKHAQHKQLTEGKKQEKTKINKEIQKMNLNGKKKAIEISRQRK